MREKIRNQKSYSRDVAIAAIDIDPSMLTVATNYFGLVQDNRLKVTIDDGVHFLKKASKTGSLKLHPPKRLKIFFRITNILFHQVNRSKQFYLMLIVKILLLV